MVAGYSGYDDAKLAVVRGEAEMVAIGSAAFSQTVESYVKTGDLVPLMQSGLAPDMIRSPSVPDIPTVREVYMRMNNGKEPSGPTWDNYKAYLSLDLSGPLLIHKDMPAEAKADMQAGFKAMMAGSDFKDMTEKTLGIRDTATAYIIGDEVAKVWDNFYKTPAAVIKAMTATY